MPAGTAHQIEQWQIHKDICDYIGIGQSTLQHKALVGSLGAASATGVREYIPPKATNAVQATTDTLVWCVWQEKTRATGSGEDGPEEGRIGVAEMRGQIPAVDDNGNVVTIAHDDWIKDANGVLYRILSPVISLDLGYWSFSTERQR